MSPHDATGAPSRDPLVAAASEVIGGPLGRYAQIRTVPRGGTSPRSGLRVLPWAPIAGILTVAATLLLAGGLVQKRHCLENGWGAPGVFWKSCYSDLPSATGEALAGQPMGTALLLRLIDLLTPVGPSFSHEQGMYLGWALTAALLLVALVVLTTLTCRSAPWNAAHVALSPLIILVVLVAPDLWGVTLTSVALWLWSRDHPVSAGVLMGAAIAARTYPVLILVVIGLLAARAGVAGRWAVMAGWALISGTVISLAGALLLHLDPTGAYRLWVAGEAGLGSMWYLATLGERPLQIGILTVLTALGWVLALAVGVALTFSARHRPTVAEVSLVVLAIVLVTGKSFPVQASLWLLPLVALAGLRWRDHLVWVTTEGMYFVVLWLYLGGRDQAQPSMSGAWFGLFLLLRILGVLWLAFAAARAALERPARAKGRLRVSAEADEPDEVAGPMTGEPDAIVVSYR
ncbi:hypothetical protein [Gephyromycinifex aptenodytis]|uniref:hypothetical protein n=1 Tax=Gephyromycinifex aptenodytis TaxID=2716227 RepID=UPI00144769C7|nr:hypothetical protein [Gephyromycinifex aptenodytis]